jgi:hypothetical protein
MRKVLAVSTHMVNGMRRKRSAWLLIGTMAALIALRWINTVLAETDGDG